jgi:hypothetical protein
MKPHKDKGETRGGREAGGARWLAHWARGGGRWLSHHNITMSARWLDMRPWAVVGRRHVSHPVFKAKTRCSSYVCPGSSCHTYGQNVSTEYQCLYYNESYYKSLVQVQKGLNSGMDPILPQAVDQGFRTPRRNLHQSTPHHLSSRTQQQHAKSMASVST